jgi:hypothetical protein
MDTPIKSMTEGFQFHYVSWYLLHKSSRTVNISSHLGGKVAGVLWADADAVLNYWSLTGFNKQKIWLPTTYMTGRNLGWKALPEPESADKAAEKDLISTSELFYRQWPSWARDNHKAMLDHFAGGKSSSNNLIPLGRVPVVYLPTRVLGNLSELVTMLAKKDIRGDYAAPLALMSVSRPEELDSGLASFEKLNPDKSMDSVTEVFDLKHAGLAPWDFTNQTAVEKLLNLMTGGDSRLASLAQKWGTLEKWN